MKTMQEQAEQHAKEVWGVYYNDIDEDCNETRGENSIKDFVAGATSDSAKEYWQRGMYSEAQIKQLEKYLKESDTVDMDLVYWLDQNKKKP